MDHEELLRTLVRLQQKHLVVSHQIFDCLKGVGSSMVGGGVAGGVAGVGGGKEKGYMQDYTFPRLGSFVKRMCILHGYHPSDHDVDIWQADFLGCKEDVDSAKAEYSRWAALSVEAIEVYFSGDGKPLEMVRKGDTTYKIKPNGRKMEDRWILSCDRR